MGRYLIQQPRSPFIRLVFILVAATKMFIPTARPPAAFLQQPAVS